MGINSAGDRAKRNRRAAGDVVGVNIIGEVNAGVAVAVRVADAKIATAAAGVVIQLTGEARPIAVEFGADVIDIHCQRAAAGERAEMIHAVIGVERGGGIRRHDQVPVASVVAGAVAEHRERRVGNGDGGVAVAAGAAAEAVLIRRAAAERKVATEDEGWTGVGVVDVERERAAAGFSQRARAGDDAGHGELVAAVGHVQRVRASVDRHAAIRVGLTRDAERGTAGQN